MKSGYLLLLASLSAAVLACSQPNRPLPGDTAASAAPAAVLSSGELAPSASAPAGDAADPPFRLTASIRELMDSEIDPAADFLWASVASISTRVGLEERRPHTDEEWLEVRRHAITLIEATNLLVMKGRRVSHTYIPAGGAGELDTNEAQQKIAANRELFVSFAERLQETGLQTLAAIDAKNADQVFELGGAIDDACESCHVTFWYPNLPSTYK
jgi:hypothetical protein